MPIPPPDDLFSPESLADGFAMLSCRMSLEELIKSSKQQAIPFSDFLRFVLYEEGLGYYARGADIFSKNRDFVTAPQLGEVFGTCLAAKIASYKSSFPEGISICEFGAGTGRLAFRIINELRRQNIKLKNYSIVEVSSSLQQMQRKIIHHNAPSSKKIVKWVTSLDPDSFEGIIIANEVVDAIPFELFEYCRKTMRQGYVNLSRARLKLVFEENLTTDFKRCIKNVPLPITRKTYRSELHCQAQAWLKTVMEYLKRGTALIIDYGYPAHEYYHKERNTGTMACFRLHHVHHDPLECPGIQDITTHVDFSALAKVGEKSGGDLGGFTTLAGFLLDSGLTDIKMPSNLKDAIELKREIHTLTSPTEMGELFKVLELTKNLEATPNGFRETDHSHRL